MMDLETHLYDLEVSLWVAETRGDRAYMDRVLGDAFVEFGRSGRKYTRDQILDAPIEGEIEIRLPLPAFRVRLIADGVALATYRSDVGFGGEIEKANRASLWRRDESGDWHLEFHQGTPA